MAPRSSFGKRGPDIQQVSPKSEMEASKSSAPKLTSPSAFPRKLLSIAAGVLAIVALLGAANLTLRSIGSTLHKKYQARAERLSGDRPTQKLLKTDYASGWTFASCRMEPATQDVKINWQEQQSMEYSLGGKAVEQLEKMSAFLQCVAEAETQKLCDSKVRSAFIRDMELFLSDHRALSKVGIGTFAHPIPEMAEAASGLSQKMASARNSVLVALQKVAAKGYVAPRDFGWFGNAELKNLVSQERVAGQPCG